MCFGFRPCKFDPKIENDSLILDEEDEVSDMYFLLEGTVGICYYMMTQGLSKKQISIGLKLDRPNYICDYYVCFNKKSEFIYMA